LVIGELWFAVTWEEEIEGRVAVYEVDQFDFVNRLAQLKVKVITEVLQICLN
jgi:hypothetical protein